MKRLSLLFILLSFSMLTACGGEGKTLIPHTFQIPKEHEVIAHSAEWVEFKLDGSPSGEYRVIDMEEYNQDIGKLEEHIPILDTKDLLYEGKQVFLQDGSRIGAVVYYLFDNEQDVVHMFHFNSPQFAPEWTNAYVKTMKRLDE